MLLDYGIIVGHHKFSAYIADGGLDYDYYNKYIRKTYYLENKIPRCYINSLSTAGDALTETPITLMDIDPQFDGMDIWNYFKIARGGKGTYTPMLRHYAKVVADVETGIPHCFGFGQFTLIFSMFRNMVFESSKDEFHLLNQKNFLILSMLVNYHVLTNAELNTRLQ